jgi:hypothetical protein
MKPMFHCVIAIVDEFVEVDLRHVTAPRHVENIDE